MGVHARTFWIKLHTFYFDGELQLDTFTLCSCACLPGHLPEGGGCDPVTLSDQVVSMPHVLSWGNSMQRNVDDVILVLVSG